jgi:hypothetical protein
MYGRIGRVTGLLILLIGAVPVFYYTMTYGVAFVSNPELYEGDRLEQRTCRICEGTGKEPADGRPRLDDCCSFCAGRRKVRVIVPGPKRPTRLWGAVVDAARVQNLAGDPGNLRAITHPFLPGSAPKIPGGIPRARVVFKPAEGEPVAIDTDETGRFSRRLAPGLYRVSISARGYRLLEEPIEVAPLTVPIWLEKATLLREPDSAEEAQSMYGLVLIAGLSRGEQEALFRFSPGTP